MTPTQPTTNGSAETNPPALHLERTFAAPRELVFRAWGDAEQVRRWWGPKGFTLPHCTLDFRPGGVFHYCMRSPDGQDFWGKITYREIAAPERLVYVDTFSDEQGNRVSPTRYFGPDSRWPEETLVTITFAEQAGQTRMTVHSLVGPLADAEREGAQQGWSEMLERLGASLAAA